MRQSTRLNLFGALLLGAAALSACAPSVTSTGPQTPATPQTSQPATPEATPDPGQPVTIAMLAPMGAEKESTANLGRALVNAARMAAVDLGERDLELRIYDTRGQAGTALSAAERAVADGADLIVGPLFGSSTRAIAPVAATAGINVISFSTDTSVAGGPVYLSGFLPEMAARRVARFARGRGFGSIAVFHPNNATGDAGLRGAETAVRSGVVLAQQYQRTSEGIQEGSKLFADNVLASGATAIMFPESGQALQFVGALVRNYGVEPDQYKFLGLGGWNSRATLAEPSLRGGWFPAPDPAEMKTFVDQYQTAYGELPPSLAVLGYDGVLIAGQMLENARRSGAQKIFSSDALTDPRGFRGSVGPIRFGADGLSERGMAILEVGDGVFNTVDPAPSVFLFGS